MPFLLADVDLGDDNDSDYGMPDDGDLSDDHDSVDDDNDKNPVDPPLSSVCYQLASGHPNRSTHAVFKIKPGKEYILTFIGGPLPRPDVGFREKYALVMLALFAPNGWRDPKNLKSELETWNEAFLRTDFESRSKDMMKHMNMLYEYYEASHDFSAQR